MRRKSPWGQNRYVRQTDHHRFPLDEEGTTINLWSEDVGRYRQFWGQTPEDVFLDGGLAGRLAQEAPARRTGRGPFPATISQADGVEVWLSPCRWLRVDRRFAVGRLPYLHTWRHRASHRVLSSTSYLVRICTRTMNLRESATRSSRVHRDLGIIGLCIHHRSTVVRDQRQASPPAWRKESVELIVDLVRRGQDRLRLRRPCNQHQAKDMVLTLAQPTSSFRRR